MRVPTAIAVAKIYRTALLFKGEDFDKTDIRPATEARGGKPHQTRVGPEVMRDTCNGTLVS